MWWYCLSSCLLHIITLFALKQVCERTWITALVNVPLVLTFAWFSYSRRCWLLCALPSRPQPPPRSFTQEEWTLVNSRVACPRISPLLYHNCTLFFDGNQKFSRGQTCSCSKTVRRQTVLGGGSDGGGGVFCSENTMLVVKWKDFYRFIFALCSVCVCVWQGEL